MRRLLFTGLAVIGLVVPAGATWAQHADTATLSGSAATPDARAGSPTPTTLAPPAKLVEVADRLAERNKITCRDRIATGSRLAYARDCHTRAEWEEITRIARDYINGQQLKGLNAAPPNG
jgi:cytochrome c5